jgi:DNA-binding HxlR family transcriptional regulator
MYFFVSYELKGMYWWLSSACNEIKMKNKSVVAEATQMCAVDYAFKRIGGKYKARILWYLNMKKVLRYGELTRTLPDITTKMLTQTLRELEEDNLIVRKMYHEVPPKVEYSLTETAQELIPFIAHLHNWGKKQIEKESLANRIHADERALAVCQTECGLN